MFLIGFADIFLHFQALACDHTGCDCYDTFTELQESWQPKGCTPAGESDAALLRLGRTIQKRADHLRQWFEID